MVAERRPTILVLWIHALEWRVDPPRRAVDGATHAGA
eukprot:CAMPEP_0204493750 /NCGR_PEP_ID=MMETSP0471-20130131/82753_1 /ASSEMBLY_ACC=CAM_ASM_000602 /TAXON_ID=2969 /ORGANISM="Oxyrrhis marina" /LENGTH=36 /DNA_ID= /DNA_START= /DNA_END= /DNA_ORIENTATION=